MTVKCYKLRCIGKSNEHCDIIAMHPEYSNYSNKQYIPNQYYYPMAAYAPPIAQQTNRIYVNKNFMQPPVSNTVLVNPNFSRQVHVNPNFSKPKTVFVNPNVFNKVGGAMQPPKTASSTIPTTTTTSSTMYTKYSKVNSNLSMVKKTYSVNNLIKAPIIKTKTKLVRVATKSKINSTISQRVMSEKSYKPKQIISRHKLIRNNLVQKSNIVKTKYKLVRSSNQLPKSPRMRQQLRKLSVSMLNSPNKFKLDNRTRKQSCTIIRSRYKLTKKAYMMRLDPQNSIIKNTKFKLIRSGKLSQSTNNSSDKLKKTPMLVRKKKFTKRNLVKINKRKLQKNNIPCEIYNKRGTCKGLANGKCSKKHDPNQIQICVWFLQGICRDDKCTLSHKASPEKMPTCKFYLEGICHKDNCPYLHVKLSRNAPVCRDFINGYCAKARECDKRHQFLCPDFERDGKCSKKLCRYPHGKAVRQYKDTLLNVIARNRKSKVQRKGKAQPVNNKVRAHVKTENKQDNVDNKRYYECPSSVANGVSNVGKNVEDSEEIEEVGSIFDRPKLGALPSFISL